MNPRAKQRNLKVRFFLFFVLSRSHTRSQTTHTHTSKHTKDKKKKKKVLSNTEDKKKKKKKKEKDSLLNMLGGGSTKKKKKKKSVFDDSDSDGTDSDEDEKFTLELTPKEEIEIEKKKKNKMKTSPQKQQQQQQQKEKKRKSWGKMFMDQEMRNEVIKDVLRTCSHFDPSPVNCTRTNTHRYNAWTRIFQHASREFRTTFVLVLETECRYFLRSGYERIARTSVLCLGSRSVFESRFSQE
jgi:hypothetical protein